MRTLELTTKPVSINARYTISRGRNILTRDYRDAKEALQWEIASQWSGDPLTEEVTLNVFQYLPNANQDIDAYLKILFDAMTGIVYKDDKQITELSTLKFHDKQHPRIVIQVL